MSKVPSSLITEAFKGISFSAWNGALSPDLFKALEDLLKHAEANYCTHENELYRGGQIWTICRDCGK
jgi:hypothetical protein